MLANTTMKTFPGAAALLARPISLPLSISHSLSLSLLPLLPGRDSPDLLADWLAGWLAGGSTLSSRNEELQTECVNLEGCLSESILVRRDAKGETEWREREKKREEKNEERGCVARVNQYLGVERLWNELNN